MRLSYTEGKKAKYFTHHSNKRNSWAHALQNLQNNEVHKCIQIHKVYISVYAYINIHMYMCIYIYKWIFNFMDCIPIISDNGGQCLGIDYIYGTVAVSSTHYLYGLFNSHISAPDHTWVNGPREVKQLAQGSKLLSSKAGSHT